MHIVKKTFSNSNEYRQQKAYFQTDSDEEGIRINVIGK